MQITPSTNAQRKQPKTPIWGIGPILLLLSGLITYLFLENYLLIVTRPTDSLAYIAAQLVKYALLVIVFAPFAFRLKGKTFTKFVPIIVLTLYGLLLSGETAGRIFTSLRDNLLYFYIFLIVSNTPIKQKDLVFKRLMGLLLCLVLINILYAAVTFITFDGDLSKFYFYAVAIQPFPLSEPNYIRNEQLRASGLFASPIIFSNLLILPCAFALATLLKKFSRQKILLLAVLIGGVLLTQTRAPFIVLSVSIGSYALLKITKRPMLVIAFIIGVIFASFFGLSFLYGLNLLEPSAAGRVDQTNLFIERILSQPLGLGLGGYGAQFENASDLSVLTVFYNFGIFMGAFYYLLLLNQVRRIAKMLVHPPSPYTASQEIQLTSAFLALTGILVMSINTNVLDSIVPMLNALIIGICCNLVVIDKNKLSLTYEP